MTSATKGYFVIGLAVMGLTYGCGYAQANTEYIEVPVVKKEYVYQTKEVEVVKTEPLPSACSELPALAAKVTEGDNILDGAVGEIQLALQELGRAAFEQDINQINEVTEVIREQKGIIDETVIVRAQSTINLDKASAQCEKGLKSGA
jgi:hypothetical protein